MILAFSLILPIVVWCQHQHKGGEIYNSQLEEWTQPMLCDAMAKMKVFSMDKGRECPTANGSTQYTKMADMIFWEPNPAYNTIHVKTCFRACSVRSDMAGFFGLGAMQQKWSEIEAVSAHDCILMPLSKTERSEAGIYPSHPDDPNKWVSFAMEERRSCKDNAAMAVARIRGQSLEIEGIDTERCSIQESSCINSFNWTLSWKPTKFDDDKYIPVLKGVVAKDQDKTWMTGGDLVFAYNLSPTCELSPHSNIRNRGIIVPDGRYLICQTHQGNFVSHQNTREFDQSEFKRTQSTIDDSAKTYDEMTVYTANALRGQMKGNTKIWEALEAYDRVSRNRVTHEFERDMEVNIPHRKRRFANTASFSAASLQGTLNEMGDAVRNLLRASIHQLCERSNKLLSMIFASASDQTQNTMLIRELSGNWYTTGRVVGKHLFVQECLTIKKSHHIPEEDGECHKEVRVNVTSFEKPHIVYMDPITHIVVGAPTKTTCSGSPTVPVSTPKGPGILNKKTMTLSYPEVEDLNFLEKLIEIGDYDLRFKVNRPISDIQTQLIVQEIESQLTGPSQLFDRFLAGTNKAGRSTEATKDAISEISEVAASLTWWNTLLSKMEWQKIMLLYLFTMSLIHSVAEYFLPNSWSEWFRKNCSLATILFNIFFTLIKILIPSCGILLSIIQWRNSKKDKEAEKIVRRVIPENGGIPLQYLSATENRPLFTP